MGNLGEDLLWYLYVVMSTCVVVDNSLEGKLEWGLGTAQVLP